MGTGRLRRALFGGGRWVRPRPLARLALWSAIAAVFAAEVAFFLWATRSYDPARTIAAARSMLREPIRLETALGVEWREALAHAGKPGSWDHLLAPPLPPALCAQGAATQDSVSRDSASALRLDDAVRALDAAVRRTQDPDRIERQMEALREIGPVRPGGVEEFVLRYNLSRAHHAAGDGPAAAEMIEPVFDGLLAAPDPAKRVAPARRDLAALAFHARYLAGAIAYRRGEMAEAIRNYRLAINAAHMVAEGDSSSVEAQHRRITVDPPGNCTIGRGDVLTSLDAYAALVAAYMAFGEFTDPPRLPPEVRRTRLEIDPDDPFRPVLRHARAIAGGAGRSPIPENLLWAASNLQRVYHHNRMDPDPRLAVTRAILLLRLTSDDAWVDAMRASGDTDVCAMLAGVAAALERDESARALARRGAASTDSAQAAVAIHAVSRLQRECGRDRVPDVGDDVRSAWLQHARAMPGSRLPGIYEGWRLTLQDALRPTAAADRGVEAVLDRVDDHVRVFGGGRVPSELSASLNAPAGHRFVTTWRRAVFEDVADVLADVGSASSAPAARRVLVSSAGAGGGRVIEIPAGRAASFLATLESAIAHAGLRPAQVHAPREMETLARAGGRAALLRYRIRYFVRSFPQYAVAGLGAAFVLTAALLIALHVSWWRYHLLVRDRLYAQEQAERDGFA